MVKRFITGIVFAAIAASPAFAAQCGGDFHAFLGQMAQDAQAAGVSRGVIDRAFAGLTPDQNVLAFDRRQRGMFHTKSFEEYARTRVIPARINRARKLMQVHAQLLARVERRFGVPAPVIVAIWTLESDNGTGDMGRLPVVRTLATLAHDCRRSELFQGELIAALKIVQRGDLPLRDLVGANAGEIGQTQFLPSSYIKYGVDFDGDGRVDLRHSVPDVLASTANLLKMNGWQAGAPYGEGTPNFEGALREWNHSEVYRRTIVLIAEKIWGEVILRVSRSRRSAISAFTRVFNALGGAPQNRAPDFFDRAASKDGAASWFEMRSASAPHDETNPSLHLHHLFGLGAHARDALDLERRAAGFLGDGAVLLDDEAARGFVLGEAAEQFGRHAPVGALRAVFIDDVEKDEFPFGVGSGFFRHAGFSRRRAAMSKEKPRRAGRSALRSRSYSSPARGESIRAERGSGWGGLTTTGNEPHPPLASARGRPRRREGQAECKTPDKVLDFIPIG